jgi:hypothetical protein
MFGGKLIKAIGCSMNKRVDVDSRVISGLTNLRKGAEREVAVDQTLLDTSIRVFVSVFLLVAAGMIFFLIALRMR